MMEIIFSSLPLLTNTQIGREMNSFVAKTKSPVEGLCKFPVLTQVEAV